MKKYLLSFAVLLMSMVVFNACSSDDPEPEPVPPTITTEAAVENLIIIDGETVTISPTYKDVDANTKYEWSIDNKVISTDSTLTYTPESDGEYIIVLRVTNSAGTSRKEFKVTVRENLKTLNFEGSEWSKWIPSSQVYGCNLIYGEEAANYLWTDEVTGLSSKLTFAYGGSSGFAEGGVVVSNYIDHNIQEHATPDYQLSVPEGNNSQNFAIVYCDASIQFPEGVKHLIKSMQIGHTTYELGVVNYGNEYAKNLTEEGDSLILTITADNDKTVKVNMARNGEVLKQWTPVDLTSLGEVNKLTFTMKGSDSSTWEGTTYLNTPAYFAFDNVVVKF
ncbi:MAG: DUF4465 domain-containing protein [Bacteroidaceae bacterium]|nr:DUF4465 domain-containing protein [Bacteroidaceae bacterium]